MMERIKVSFDGERFSSKASELASEFADAMRDKGHTVITSYSDNDVIVGITVKKDDTNA